jgi:predicted O-methyltransferase YrrM
MNERRADAGARTRGFDFGSWMRRKVQAAGRGIGFRRAMRRFLADPAALVSEDHPLWSELIQGWGNPHWCAGPEYLAAALREVAARDGDVLECGSGLSTVLLAAALRGGDRRLFVLEHDPRWAARVRRELRRFDVAAPVVVCEAPLRALGEFHWYSSSLPSPPESFAAVFCDGPPGATPGGRYGLLPVVGARLRRDCVILLDDAARPEEQAIVDRWATERPLRRELCGVAKPFFKLTLLSDPAA